MKCQTTKVEVKQQQNWHLICGKTAKKHIWFSTANKCTLLLLLIDMSSFVVRRLPFASFFVPTTVYLLFCCASSSLGCRRRRELQCSHKLGACVRVCVQNEQWNLNRSLVVVVRSFVGSLFHSYSYSETLEDRRRRSLFRQIEHVIDFTPVNFFSYVSSPNKKDRVKAFLFILLLNARSTPISLT